MKKLLILFILVVSFSCTTNDNELENFKTDNSLEQTRHISPSSFQIVVKVTFYDTTSGNSMRLIREKYFSDCDTNPYYDSCGKPLSIEMYSPYVSDIHVEYWIITTCNDNLPLIIDPNCVNPRDPILNDIDEEIETEEIEIIIGG